MSENVRVRFAPSPTGFLHIGGARTALFNYLYAKHHQGSFVLRIEDTDKERSTEEAVEAILNGLRWLGLEWDEGPVFQSQRQDLYEAKFQELLDRGKAYRCYCTSEELEERRNQMRKEGKPPRYDGRCREHIGSVLDKPHTFRFLVPEGETVVPDLIRGEITFQNQEIDDLVIARSDGSPTYNFVVVVDDADMGITHVIRGDDHLNNTPKQILLYQALGHEIPKFAHLPLILGQDKKRLSKRHGATSVEAYRDMGYFSHSVINFLARLGWSHGDQEIFSLEELVEHFGFENVGKSSGVFNAEKLLWLNQHYIKEAPVETLLEGIKPFIEISEERLEGDGWKKTLESLRDRAKTLVEMAELAQFYFSDDLKYDEKAVEKFLKAELKKPFERLKMIFMTCHPFEEKSLKPAFEGVLGEFELKMGKLAQPLRVALVGGTVSPGIFEVLEILGQDRVLKRVDQALAMMK